MASSMEPFAGEETFAAPPAAVFKVLTDLDATARIIPDLVSSEKVDARTLKCVVKPGFSFIRSTMKATLTIVEAVEPSAAVLHVDASGIGTSMRSESTMKIEPAGAGCKVRWQAQITAMKGLVSAVPQGLIRAAADKVLGDGWKAIRGLVEKG